MTFIQVLKHDFKLFLKNLLVKWNGNEDIFIRNINKDSSVPKQKKVLISYLSMSALNEIDTATHTQIVEFSVILDYFIKHDYLIDVIAHNNSGNYDFAKEYDVIFGFGQPFRTAKKKNLDALSILYLTENPPDISYKLERERILYYKKRHGKSVKIERSGKCFIQEDFDDIDIIIYMCSKQYINHVQSYFLPPTGFKKKDYNNDYNLKSTKTFIWLGGFAAIHKGLDIAIDVFNKHPDWTLYVLGIDTKSLKKYGIKVRKNIHVKGFVDVQSDEFIEILKKAVYMLLPSCSEATPTAALTAMRYGLIPILCRSTGFDDNEQNVVFLDDYHIEYVEKELESRINKYSIENCKVISERIMEYADDNFSIEKYKERINVILDKIL